MGEFYFDFAMGLQSQFQARQQIQSRQPITMFATHSKSKIRLAYEKERLFDKFAKNCIFFQWVHTQIEIHVYSEKKTIRLDIWLPHSRAGGQGQ